MRSQSNTIGVQTLYDLAKLRSDENPDGLAMTFLTDGEEKTEQLTYLELDCKSKVIAASLQFMQAKNKTVLLMFAPGIDFICAFLGCQYAGAIAVPVYAPSSPESWERVLMIAKDAQASIILSNSKLANKVLESQNELANKSIFRWIMTDKLAAELQTQWQPPEYDSRQTAFLQYTSGSTGTPKGVTVSHSNILHNSHQIYKSFKSSSDNKVVTWLPAYHDMGLIGGIIQPLYVGFPLVLLSPIHFVQRPVRWLRAISKYKGTTSGGPNFGFDLCLKISTEDCHGLDLSSWKVAFNGGEPVRKQTLDSFIKKFAPYGFNPDALLPCYGLAESTLFVTGTQQGDSYSHLQVDAALFSQGILKIKSDQNEVPSIKIISSGKPQESTPFEIVDPKTFSICPPGIIGEIWVGGESVSAGYWNKPSINIAIFQARINGDTTETNYLRTGDTGFIYKGELFVTGRLNDKLIINGKNLFPQDIEQIAENAHPKIIANGSAAFSKLTVTQKEEFVLVCELKRGTQSEELTEIRKNINQKVFFQFGVSPAEIVFIRQRSLPRTSSGKVKRYLCKQHYSSNLLNLYKA